MRIGGLSSVLCYFYQAEDGIRAAHYGLEFRRVLFRSGWLIREDSQFHWTNRGYRDFSDFLADLSSAKRKNIRKGRERAVEGLEIVHLTGAALTEAHWDIFWTFYQEIGRASCRERVCQSV